MTPEFLLTYPAMTEPLMWRDQKEQERAVLIVRDVALRTGVHSAQILGPFSDRATCKARYQAMREIRDELAWSTPKIGKFFDRDHTTVCYGLGLLTRKSSPRSS